MQRRTAVLSVGWGSMIGLSVSAQPPDQEWPRKPLRMMVVYPAGGISDQISRAMADRLGALLGVAVLVENRAGAGGSVGMDALAKATPDGYTLAFSAISPLTLLPQLAQLGYTTKDVAPIIGVMHTPTLLIGTPSFEGHRFKDIATLAQSNPGGLRWVTSGFGTTGHMVLEQVRLATGAKIVHIPYKGGGQQLNDALSGHFELLSTNVAAPQLQHIQNKKFKPLAVGAPARLKNLPQVPTFAELGYPKANLTSVFGVFAPAGTPQTIIQKLNAALNKVLLAPEFRLQLLSIDNLPLGGMPDKLSELIAKETKANEPIIRQLRIREK
jgi:tripartite-type tricarboxylate transporter receptor subunit TctC